MRLPEPSHRVAAVILVATALLFACVGAWAFVVRSAIPLRIDGTVTSIDGRQEKHPGVDDAWFVGVDGEERHLDTALATSLAVGDTVRKDRWSTTLVVNGHPRSLHLSNEASAMLLLAPCIVLTCAALALPSRRSRRPQKAKAPDPVR
jgi:hypothetical protein